MRKKQPEYRGDGFIENLRYRRNWKRITSLLAVFVVIGTVSSLMLPAITMSDVVCGLEEHLHTEDCCETALVPSLSCDRDTLAIHSHTPDCLDAEGRTVCGQVDFVVHTHDGQCWNTDGSLACSLEEIEEHRHDDNCYQIPEIITDEGHVHIDDCYEWVTSESPTCGIQETPVHQHNEACFAAETTLICMEPEIAGHTHGDTCYNLTDSLTCGSEEFEGHSHVDGCYGEDGALICELEEITGHTHDPSCYTQTKELICEEPEIDGHTHGQNCYIEAGTLVCTTEETPGHQHTDECYGLVKGGLLCTEEEREPVIEFGDPVLVCEEPEVILHTHDEKCYEYDDQGNPTSLICGKPEIVEHQHTEACFTETEVTSLVCQLPEHTHTEECSGSAALSEEEQAQVDALILLIDTLPSNEEVTAQLAAYDEAGDTAGRDACTAALVEQLSPIFGQYHAMTDGQQSAVTNAAKLIALEWLLPEEPTEITEAETLPTLTEEEQQQVADVISLIEGLPPVEEIEAEFARLAEDEEGLAAYRAKILSAVQAAFDGYDALTDTQKAAVTNGEKLDGYRYLLEDQKVAEIIAAIAELPSIEEMEAELERLADDPESLASYQEQLISSIESVSGSFDTLTDAQKAAVSNIDQLREHLAWMNEHIFGHERIYEVKQYTDSSYTEVLEASSTAVALKGKLPIGSVVRSYPVEFSMGEDGPVLFAQDITIYQADGSEYQPEAPVEVTISGLDIPGHGELDVFHDLQDEYGGMERMAYTIDGNTVTFEASSFSTYAIVDAYVLNRIAEPAIGGGTIDSGWINYWSDKLNSDPVMFSAPDAALLALDGGNGKPSDEQVTNRGGSKTDGTVTVSKTIQGTDVENVFDITLNVDTTTNITEVMKDPDMAVVIVMDISNTMNSAFGSSTRYKAAVESAEAFMDKFAASNNGYSKLGYVAFNTDAHEIFGLSKCTTTEVAGLKNTLRTKTSNIINAAGYGDSHKRFTNVEAGLKRASDMLDKSGNSNKYIIFLSDGFPTTYIKSGYVGWDPYCSSGTKGADGVFYDYVTGYYCSYGTSYSDKAAIKARSMAATIKQKGTTIYSIGVDVGGQTIDGYDHRSGLSVIDRTSTNYELGSATDTNAFKNWLGSSIGSGYYYDSTNTAGLQAAYDDIFKKIQSSTEQANALKWIASDPIPDELEFIGFYDKQNTLHVHPNEDHLTGSGTESAENTISYAGDNKAISWDIKNSGYTTTGSGNSTTYHYTVTYRVRLKNELDGFVEDQSYDTNGETTLTYQEVTVVDGKETISPDKTINFPIPAVKGYLGELKFQKFGQNLNDDTTKSPLADAEFLLSHDDENCNICRGDGISPVAAMKGKTYNETSGPDGLVTFSDLPSGHQYMLKETKAPAGYQLSNAIYSVRIDYDIVSVQKNGDETQPWDFTDGKIPEVINYAGAVLPATGGIGTSLYTFSGWAIITVACALMYNSKRNKRKGAR